MTSTVVKMVVGSVEYLRERLVGTVNGAVVNVATDLLDVAIRPVGDLTPWDWQTAAWDTDNSTSPPTYYGRVLIGTGALVLTAGVYDVRWRIHDNPEVPIVGDSQLYLAEG